jgi:hypothetical protein
LAFGRIRFTGQGSRGFANPSVAPSKKKAGIGKKALPFTPAYDQDKDAQGFPGHIVRERE